MSATAVAPAAQQGEEGGQAPVFDHAQGARLDRTGVSSQLTQTP